MSAANADPFAALEQAAARQAAAEAALTAVAQARCRLVLGRDATSVFFAALALRLAVQIDWDQPTMATDGRRLVLNPTFVTGLSPAELLGVVGHEVLHCALAHHARRGARDAARWNLACDLAVNPLLLDAGFTLPANRLMPGEGAYRDLEPGKSAEEYYGRLPERPANPDPAGDPGGCGGVTEPADDSPAAASQGAAEWSAAVAQARQVAAGRGELPGGLARLVEAVLHPSVDWREVLRAFVSRQARNDYRWTPPNRRFVHAGLYLPGLRSEELGTVLLAVDTSGSISPDDLGRFAAEAAAVLEAFDCVLTVLYHDTAVQRVETWTRGDGPLRLSPVGGGGTSHACVFDWLANQPEPPSCVVCLTDLETVFPAAAPAVPVLWAVVGGTTAQPPFGDRVAVG